MNLSNEELICVQGGASLSSQLLNAISRAFELVYNLGQSFGSSIRRIVTGRYC